MNAMIDIRLFATLSRYLPRSPEAYSIASGTTVLDVIRTLEIPESEVKLAFVNSVKVPLDVVLKNGDRLGLFPAIGGG